MIAAISVPKSDHCHGDQCIDPGELQYFAGTPRESRLAADPADRHRALGRTGAELVSKYLFPVSFRSLEAWPLPTRHVKGKAIISTTTLFEIAYAKLTAAPITMGGRPRSQSLPHEARRDTRQLHGQVHPIYS